ncbi:hypothetical protein XENTR_v10005122 [Xenopus tropicalis]|nr:hypothetical protein XENTR_v10005122 [Xenopus tropicalis]KAE8622160.1 hypothetical protein XENTR_v10005122 [Xenopus tropicalis]
MQRISVSGKEICRAQGPALRGKERKASYWSVDFQVKKTGSYHSPEEDELQLKPRPTHHLYTPEGDFT